MDSEFVQEGLFSRQKELAALFRGAEPYPFLALDAFLKPEAADALLSEFPSRESDWSYYHHANEKKRAFSRLGEMGPHTQALIRYLGSETFVSFLQSVSGLRGLFLDLGLEGGGWHETRRGGFLNMHIDFLSHAKHRNWSRQINLLLFLNKDWKEEYGGFLELWSADMKRCVRKIRPDFNRCVIFQTGPKAYHGVPEILACPADRSRKSLALYYFREEAAALRVQSTDYRPRPADPPSKRAWISLDRFLLRIYAYVKRYAGVPEKAVSRVLRFFSR